MTRVTSLLEELNEERKRGKPYKTVPQTVRIPDPSLYKLRALAGHLGRPYGNLASRLLVAAIDDAIDALPHDKRERWTFDMPPMTAREYVSQVAQMALIDAYGPDYEEPELAEEE